MNALAEPCVVDGPINGTIFRAYVDQFLVPELRPGNIVVLDNLGSHRAQAIRSAILAAGAKFAFLPPHSPDFNPIEQVFAKVKHWLRMAQARSIDTIHDNVARLPSTMGQRECANYFRNAGYASS